MNICVNTDASFNKKAQVGTWAYWIVSNSGRLHGSGALKKSCYDSTEAEMKAICNALTVITEKPELMAKAKTIFINTDSMNAIHIFTDDKKAINKWGLKKKNYEIVRNLYRHLKNKKFLGKEIIFKHVKAHQGTDEKRTWVNNWLDHSAKIEMEKLVGPKT